VVAKWYYFTFSDALMRVPADGGGETIVVEPVVESGFAKVDSGIYFVRPAEDSTCSLQFYDFGTQTTRFIADLGMEVSGAGVAVSPDEQTFLFVPQVKTEADLMLVENFR
jgi:hypothetical protein